MTSRFLKHTRRQGGALIVSFSASGLDGNDNEPYQRLLQNGASVLLIDCEAPTWHLDIWDELSAEIARAKRQLAPSQVLYYGAAADAFPALRAHLDDPEAMSLALSPELAMGVPLLHSAHIRPMSIEAHLAAFNGGRMELVFGRCSPSDAEFFSRLPPHMAGVGVSVLPCGHNTQPWLIGSGKFEACIAAMLADNALPLPGALAHSSIEEAPFVYPLFHAVVNNLPFRSPQVDAEENYFWLHTLARKAAQEKDFHGAYELLLRAKNSHRESFGRDFDVVERDGWADSVFAQFEEWLFNQTAELNCS